MKNKIKCNFLVNSIAFFVLFSYNIYAEDLKDNKKLLMAEKIQIPEDLSIVIKEIPSNYKEIDNIRIQLLRSKVDPQNATHCLKALPNLIQTDSFQNQHNLIKINVISNFIYFFDDIFAPVNNELYIEVCHDLKNNEANHIYIYYLIHHVLKSKPSKELNRYLQDIIQLLPLAKGRNELIISSFFDNLDEKTCIDIIDQLKEKNSQNEMFVKEIEEAKQRILYNKTHKRNDGYMYTIIP